VLYYCLDVLNYVVEYVVYVNTFDISLIVAATLTETRQFFTLYNTLEDQKAFMEKEVCLCLHELWWYIIVSF